MVQGKERITLVKEGKTSYVIVANVNDPVLQKATEVINDFTQQSTGVKFEIQSNTKRKHVFVLEQSPITTAYPEDSYSIQVKMDNIYIKGSGKGVIFAAYRYVRDVIGGKKWYSGKENTFIPKSSLLSIESDLSLFVKPSFQFREVYFPVELDPEYMDWYGLHNLEEKWGDWGHTFNKILPPSIYFKEHPEYYSLYDGKRQPLQLCLSNEEVFAHTVNYFKRRMLENPAATYWSIAANDDLGSCTCNRCQAIDRYEGGPQGSLIRFVNKVAAKFPNKKFTTLAYMQTANAPIHTHVANNVSVILSNIDAYRKNDIENEPSAATFRRQLRDWKLKAKHVFVWDYLTQFTNYLTPFPIQGTMQKSLRYLKAKGVEGVFLQGGGWTYSDMAELNAYVTANLIWDSEISEEGLINEFVEGYYGKAAPFIKDYLEARRNNLPGPSSALSIYGNPIDNRNDFLSPLAMDQYSTLLEKAEIASEGNPILESRIRRIGLGLDYTYLQQARFYGAHQHGIFSQENGQWKVRPNVRRKVDQFVKDAKKLGVIELAEAGISPDKYAQEWADIYNYGVRTNKASEGKIILKYSSDPSFPANGIETLTDSVPGYLDYSYNWLLWNAQPMDVKVHFENDRHIDTVELNFLQDARHWIFPPKELRIAVSKNGIDFYNIFTHKIEPLDENYTVEKVQFKAIINDNIRAVHISAMPFPKLPDWRYSPTRKALIACDEIWIN